MRLIIFLQLFLSFCGTKRPENNYLIKTRPKFLIDSLQGKWFNTDDSTNKILIQNNQWTESFIDINDQFKQVKFKIYFSDTLIEFTNDTLLIVNVNFSHKVDRGNYLILADSADIGIECYYLNGFAYYKGDTTFSTSPVSNFKASATVAFQKYK